VAPDEDWRPPFFPSFRQAFFSRKTYVPPRQLGPFAFHTTPRMPFVCFSFFFFNPPPVFFCSAFLIRSVTQSKTIFTTMTIGALILCGNLVVCFYGVSATQMYLSSPLTRAGPMLFPHSCAAGQNSSCFFPASPSAICNAGQAPPRQAPDSVAALAPSTLRTRLSRSVSCVFFGGFIECAPPVFFRLNQSISWRLRVEFFYMRSRTTSIGRCSTPIVIGCNFVQGGRTSVHDPLWCPSCICLPPFSIQFSLQFQRLRVLSRSTDAREMSGAGCL